MTVRLGDWCFDSVEYDRESDVLYLSIGEPCAGVGEETPEGHVWRFDEEGQFCGLTLIGAQAILNSTDGEEVDITPEAVRRVAADFSLDLLDRPRPMRVLADKQAEDRTVEHPLTFGGRAGILVVHGKVLPFRVTAPGQFAAVAGANL